MSESPAGWCRFNTPSEAYNKHLTDTKDMRINYPDGNYWKCIDHWNTISADYANNIDKCKKEIKKFQKEVDNSQASFEKKLLKKNSVEYW